MIIKDMKDQTLRIYLSWCHQGYSALWLPHWKHIYKMLTFQALSFLLFLCVYYWCLNYVFSLQKAPPRLHHVQNLWKHETKYQFEVQQKHIVFLHLMFHYQHCLCILHWRSRKRQQLLVLYMLTVYKLHTCTNWNWGVRKNKEEEMLQLHRWGLFTPQVQMN